MVGKWLAAQKVKVPTVPRACHVTFKEAAKPVGHLQSCTGFPSGCCGVTSESDFYAARNTLTVACADDVSTAQLKEKYVRNYSNLTDSNGPE